MGTSVINLEAVLKESTASGGGGGGGSDRTAVTPEADPVNGGQRVLSETLDGIPHTYGYDAQGNIILDEWASGGLQRDVDFTTVPGFGIASGNRYVNGGQIYVPAADMPALKTGLIALGAVVVPAQFWVPEYHCAFSWDHVDQRLVPASGGGVVLNTTTLISFASPGAVEQVGATFTWPGWLRGKGGQLTIVQRWDVPNAGITKTFRTKFNGTDVRNITSGATALMYQTETIINVVSDADIIRNSVGSVFPSTGDASSTSTPVQTTYTANTDITIVVSLTYTSDPGAITARLISCRAVYL
jgi:YD repeat-containing protein